MADAAIISLFLDRYRADQQDGGGARSLDAYQALFPGYESLVAGEFGKLKDLESGAAAGDGGQRIGSFKILRRLGRGGQGEVYLAEDAKLRRQVALKVIRGLGSHAVEVLARFRREAELTSRLEHPGICPVHETGTADGVAYIAMRYVRGDTVGHHIAEAKARPHGSDSGPRPLDAAEILDAVLIIEKAARILHVTHESGIIHRDVKPGNIMVTETGDPVILDFGLARDEGGDSSSLTRTGDLFGTPAYMSPEQLTGHHVHVDRRTDVYSLGVTLFEWLTLHRPFEAPTREALYQAITTREAPSARSLNPAITADLGVVVATAIEKDRNARYQTALDFAEELRRVRSHEPILARPIGPLVRLKRWARRNPGLAAAVGGLIAVLAIGLAVALFFLAQRDRALLDYDRLGDLSRLQRLQAEADGLWPCTPDKVPAMRAWIDHGSDLEKRLGGHRDVLARLRASSGDANDPAGQFKLDTTAKLVAELGAFADPDPRRGLLAQMRRRLAFAETVREDSIDKLRTPWADAVRSIADSIECPKYRGLRVTPQLGLVPIGKDPASGLWEFAHLETGAPGGVPRRGEAGRLVLTESAGIVFVLLPGGTFPMGASKPDERGAPSPNADPEAEPRESPVTEVALDPFFMSKYEMTQAQWTRLVGHNPSHYLPGSTFGDRAFVLDAAAVNLVNPVEHVSWDDCETWMGRLGLVIPTEAQWEYAARGGTTTPRWTGAAIALARAANLADAYCKQHGGPLGWVYESWSDGFAAHAPVGSLAANPFGLHDVLGNVWEWCRDWLPSYDLPPRPGDGLRPPQHDGIRVYRGGSFTVAASQTRSAFRYGLGTGFRHVNLGIRPARRLDP